MNVGDHAAQFWLLFEENGELYLEANCSHGAVGYDFMIQLSSQEVAEYRLKGTAFLDLLAQAIQDSAPGVANSSSSYKDRAVSSAIRERAQMAAQHWVTSRNTK